MKKNIKKAGGNTLLAFISVIVLFLIIEVVMKVFYPQAIDLGQRSNTLRIKLKPNYKGRSGGWSVSTNSIGLRDRDFGKKERGVFRILALGDSQTFGHGIEQEDAYPKVLERLFARNIPGRKIEVINAGVGSYCTFQEFQYLKESGFALEPDLILLGFFIGNDFGENNAFSLKKILEKKPYNEFDLFLTSHSHAYNFFKYRFYQLSARFKLKNVKNDEVVKSINVGPEQIYFPNPMAFCKKKYTPDMEKALGITKKKILEMAKYIKDRDKKMSLIIIPAMQQVYEEEWHEKAKGRIDPGDYDVFKANKILSQFSEENGIQVIDLLQPFKQLAKDEKLYLWEGHLNKEGAKEAGKEIYKALISYGLIPKE